MEEMEAVEIAYLRRTGPYGPENRQLMERLKAFLKERAGWGPGPSLLGIALDDPSRTPPDRCRYDVGIIIRGGGAAPTGHPQGPGGRTVRPSLRSLIRSGGLPVLGRSGAPDRRAAGGPRQPRFGALLCRKGGLHRCEFCHPSEVSIGRTVGGGNVPLLPSGEGLGYNQYHLSFEKRRLPHG